jgi:hypothetical protein
MPVNMTKKTIERLLKDQEMIEYEVIELRTNEFLVNIEIPGKKNISIITNNWKELFGVIS